MSKQYRGCSKLYYATVTEAVDGTITFGTPTRVNGVKAISVEISADSEELYADNVKQEDSYGALIQTRSFDCLKLPLTQQAELLGLETVEVGTGQTARQAYATAPTGATRPYLAWGYALHDGNPDLPCELVWCYKGKVTSISKASNTIDAGAGSEGQTIEVNFVAPIKPWTATGKTDLDVNFGDAITTTDVTKWFAQVVTPDNITTSLT